MHFILVVGDVCTKQIHEHTYTLEPSYHSYSHRYSHSRRHQAPICTITAALPALYAVTVPRQLFAQLKGQYIGAIFPHPTNNFRCRPTLGQKSVSHLHPIP